MKKIKYVFMVSLALLFAACDKETTQDNSRVTYYATLELDGDASLFWNAGTPFVDPGYTASLQGADVTDQVVVAGNVNTDVPGIYSLTYSIANADGFSVSESRTVYVKDATPTAISSGVWSVAATSFRVAAATTNYGNSFPVTILQLSADEFYCSDFLGGWYEYRAGYGDAYAAKGKFKLNADNTISYIESAVAGWGDACDDVAGSIDPVTGVITWVADYAGMKFNVTLSL